MKRVWDRLMTCRITKDLWLKMVDNRTMTRMDADDHKLIVRGAELILVTFMIRLFGRIWVSGSEFLIHHPMSDWMTYVKENIVSLSIICFVYIVFSNYLLGVSFRSPKVRRFSYKYIKILFFILIYVIELFVSFFYFMNVLYDYYWISLVSLLSIPVTFYAYFIVFIAILDYCIYSTDNSDNVEELKGENIDYF